MSDSEDEVIVLVKCILLSESTELIETKNCTLYKYVVNDDKHSIQLSSYQKPQVNGGYFVPYSKCVIASYEQ